MIAPGLRPSLWNPPLLYWFPATIKLEMAGSLVKSLVADGDQFPLTPETDMCRQLTSPW